MQYKDYYKILGVEKNATEAEIKKTYRKLAKKYHPDANPGNNAAEENFKNITEAYEVLGNKEKRNKYDTLGQQYNFKGGNDFDPSDFGFGNNAQYRYSSNQSSDFSDFFNMFFGGGGGGSGFDMNDIFGGTGYGSKTASRPNKGQDLSADIEITPEEGFHGAKRSISFRTSGGVEKNIEMKIPEGIHEGERIRLAKQGSKGFSGGESGDLYLNVTFKKGGKYSVEGMDLSANLDVYPWEAALGTKLPVETIDGRIIVNIPPGIKSDERIRVRGKGYKDRKGNRGDLFLKVRIVNPSRMDASVKEHYEALSKLVQR